MPKKNPDSSISDKSSDPVHFEQSLTKLEDLVEQMEDGGLSLEEALKAFESGIKLTRDCQNALNKAEQKVQILINENGKQALTEFQEDD